MCHIANSNLLRHETTSMLCKCHSLSEAHHVLINILFREMIAKKKKENCQRWKKKVTKITKVLITIETKNKPKETGCSFCKHCLNYIRHMLSKMLVSIAKFPFVTTVERSFIFVTHPHKPYWGLNLHIMRQWLHLTTTLKCFWVISKGSYLIIR